MSDFGAESPVIHQKNVEIFRVVDDKFFKPVGEMEFSGVVGSVTDFGHFFVASKSPSHPVVDTWVGYVIPLGLLQLSATLPPYESDWNLVNLRVLFLTILFRSKGVDLTIRIFNYKSAAIIIIYCLQAFVQPIL